MKTVFLDASYLLALEVANDQNHAIAHEHWNRVETAGLPALVTTTYIFSEVVTYLNSRGLHEKAVEVGEDLLASPIVRLIHVDEDLLEKGWRFLVQHQDKTYSLADCISFVLMQQLGIQTAFAFDNHFQQAGFDVEP
jgi:predicted nucleic acid-binding protein